MFTRDFTCITFGIGVGVGIATVYFTYKRNNRIRGNICDHKHPTSDSQPALQGSFTPNDLEDDDIIAEQLTRNIQFFGIEGQKKISGSFVVVIGLGGVGSHAAHMLLRSGVGRVRLVDFDQVSLSSLNRHCLATRKDVGTPKSSCLEMHFREIFPEANVESMCAMYCEETRDAILDGNPDYVLDAIDNIDTKLSLLAACKSRNIDVLCVAGAGAKADPTRLRFVDIAESASDPLARAVRYRLKKDFDIKSGITVLLSTEKPRCSLVAAGEGDGPENMSDYQVIPNFRIRTIPVLGSIPAIFGMGAASYILCHLAGQDIISEPIFRIPAKAIQTQYDRLEARLGREPDVDVDEVEILVREIWRGTSARAEEIAPLKALSKCTGGLALTIWDPSKGSVVDNLVLLTQKEADAHDEQVSKPEGFETLCTSEPEFASKVNHVLARVRAEFCYRYYLCAS